MIPSHYQFVAVDVRYGQLLGSVPLADSGATGTTLQAVDGKGGLRALAVHALPGGRAVVSVCGALLLVSCSGVSARCAWSCRYQTLQGHVWDRLVTLVGSQASGHDAPVPLLHAPAFYGSAAAVGVGSVEAQDSDRWQGHLAWPLRQPGCETSVSQYAESLLHLVAGIAACVQVMCMCHNRALVPAVSEETAVADAAALQHIQQAAGSKLSALVDAAVQSSLSVPTMAALACRLASVRAWAQLQRLAAAGCIPSLAYAPGVLPAAAEAQQHALVTALLQHGGLDVNVQDLAAALCALLADGKVSTKALANGHGNHDAAMSSDEEAAQAANGISMRDVHTWPTPLHTMVKMKHDQGVLLQALRLLRAEQVTSLVEYLSAVLAWHGKEHGDQGGVPGLVAAIAWASVLIDAQYTTIVLQVRGVVY